MLSTRHDGVVLTRSGTDTSSVKRRFNAATNNRRDAPASLRIAATMAAVSNTSRTQQIIDIACENPIPTLLIVFRPSGPCEGSLRRHALV